MAPLKIKVGSKTYMSVKLKMYISKEALRIQRDAIRFGQRQKEIGELKDLDALEVLLDEIDSLNDRKVAVIVEAYGNKFSADDVEREFTADEINEEINKILSGTASVVGKN